jgi:glutathione S-transferase
MIRLHDSLSSGNGYKVRLLLAQLGVTFEWIEDDLEKGETRTPWFLEKVSSNGRIPFLETEGGEFLPESNAILFYLADGTPLFPDGRLERARVLQWMFFEQYSHEPNIAVVRSWITHLVEMIDERRAALEQKRSRLRRSWRHGEVPRGTRLLRRGELLHRRHRPLCLHPRRG